MMIMTNTTATLALALDTTPRTLRKFLRSNDLGVGKGSRYSLPSAKREVNTLRKQFNSWSSAQDAAKVARDAAKVTPSPEVAPEVEVIDEVTTPDFDDLECPLDA